MNVVLNTGSLGWLRMWQHLFFGGLRTSVDLQTEQTLPSLAGAAEALGCRGITVEQPDQLGDAMDAAFSSDAPVVLDVRVDEDATPIHGYRRRLAEGTGHARPGTVYQLPPWRASPAMPAD